MKRQVFWPQFSVIRQIAESTCKQLEVLLKICPERETNTAGDLFNRLHVKLLPFLGELETIARNGNFVETNEQRRPDET